MQIYGMQHDTEVDSNCPQARLRGYAGCKPILCGFCLASMHVVQSVSISVMHKLAVIRADDVCASHQLFSLQSNHRHVHGQHIVKVMLRLGRSR